MDGINASLALYGSPSGANYSASNKVYVTGSGIPANTYVTAVDNTAIGGNSQPKPKITLSAGLFFAGLTVVMLHVS